MSNFNDIKVGDKVLVPVSIHVGFGVRRHFTVLKPVERVTNTLFIVDGERYHKKDGHVYNSSKYTRAYRVGDERLDQPGVPKMVDQTEQMNAFIEKKNLFIKCKTLLDDIGNDLELNRIEELPLESIEKQLLSIRNELN